MVLLPKLSLEGTGGRAAGRTVGGQARSAPYLVVRRFGNWECGSRSERLDGVGAGNLDAEVLVTVWRRQGRRRETWLESKTYYLGGRRVVGTWC